MRCEVRRILCYPCFYLWADGWNGASHRYSGADAHIEMEAGLHFEQTVRADCHM